MIKFSDLTTFTLKMGSHKKPEDGLCAMEAVAWLEGLRHSDSPDCTCPIIAQYVRRLNDDFSYGDRQLLIAYLPRLVGTVSSEHEQERAEYLVWQCVQRVALPLLRQDQALTEHANKLAAVAEKNWENASSALSDAIQDMTICDRPCGYISMTRLAVRAIGKLIDYRPRARNGERLDAVNYAGSAASIKVETALDLLNGVLAIGPGGMFSQPEAIPERAAQYRALVNV